MNSKVELRDKQPGNLAEHFYHCELHFPKMFCLLSYSCLLKKIYINNLSVFVHLHVSPVLEDRFVLWL